MKAKGSIRRTDEAKESGVGVMTARRAQMPERRSDVRSSVGYRDCW